MLTQQQADEVRADIQANIHLFSARHNKDYEMLAIYCAQKFSKLNLSEVEVHALMINKLVTT